MNAHELASRVLEDDLEERLVEASVYRPPRSRNWVATFTGAIPGQQLRLSTGTTNREQALAIARKWEAEERERRKALAKQPHLPGPPKAHPGGLTQEEIAAVLKMSTRAVRNTEKRAIAKLRRHPAVRELWREYIGQSVEESQEVTAFTREEMIALLGLARTPFELV